MPDLRVNTKGEKELRAALKRIEMHKNISKGHKEAVTTVFVPEGQRLARMSYPNQAGGMWRFGAAAIKTIRGGGTLTKAHFVAGSARVPYFQGGNFGSSRRYRQFPPKGDGDKVMYKAIKNKRDEFIDVYLDIVDRVTKDAFPG